MTNAIALEPRPVSAGGGSAGHEGHEGMSGHDMRGMQGMDDMCMGNMITDASQKRWWQFWR
ncbi:MAG: hypothetical protein ACREMQ_02370 [Longimicrobiales bacterium]